MKRTDRERELKRFTHTCGHTVDPTRYTRNPELSDDDINAEMEWEAGKKCPACLSAATQCEDERMGRLGYVWDNRSGSWVSPETQSHSIQLANDPTLFADRGDYAPEENVTDGEGYGL